MGSPLGHDCPRCHDPWAGKNVFHSKEMPRKKVDCLVHEMLLIRERRPKLNTQSDSLRVKVFLIIYSTHWHLWTLNQDHETRYRSHGYTHYDSPNITQLPIYKVMGGWWVILYYLGNRGGYIHEFFSRNTQYKYSLSPYFVVYNCNFYLIMASRWLRNVVVLFR